MKKIGLLFIGVLLTLAMLPATIGNATETTENATESISRPQVGLTAYSLEDEAIVLGEDNTIALEFSNFSKEIPVTDVLISFTSANHTVVPVYGKSNQLYLSKIKEGGKVKAELPITIVHQENGYASMSFVIQYCVGEKVLSNETSYIVIPVDVEEKLEVENVSISSTAQINSKVSLLVSYKNISETALKDICLVISGDAFAAPIELPVKDALAAGERGYFEYYLAFDSVGNKMLSLELKGVDEAGNEYVIDCGGHSVRVTGEETTENDIGDMENTENLQGNENSGETEREALKIYFVIGIIAVIMIVCLLIGAFSSKKRK